MCKDSNSIMNADHHPDCTAVGILDHLCWDARMQTAVLQVSEHQIPPPPPPPLLLLLIIIINFNMWVTLPSQHEFM
jgi:hypothetical protein